MKDDKNVAIDEIKEKIDKFVSKRDWKKFHNPVSLSEAIIVEAGELLQLFLFSDLDTIKKEALKVGRLRERIKEELADILIYSFELADHLDMDINEIIEEKLVKNSKKHPISN